MDGPSKVRAGESARFVAVANSPPVPQFIWYYNGLRITVEVAGTPKSNSEVRLAININPVTSNSFSTKQTGETCQKI